MLYRHQGALRKVEETALLPMTEEEHAEWLRRKGHHIVFHQGRYWEGISSGFFYPVHWLGKFRYQDATRPKPLCWGFRAALAAEDSRLANATIPVHLVSDLQQYTLQSLPSNRKRKIRRALNKVEVVELLKPDLLLTQGYEVMLSAYRRHGYGRLPTRDQYREMVEGYFQLKGILLLGAFIEGKLGGYTVSHLISGTLYGTHGAFSTEALPENIPSCLDFVLMEICRRSGVVSEVCLGLDTPERPSLVKYKEEMGFPIAHVPARVWIVPLVRGVLRRIFPFKYYRLTGNPKALPMQLLTASNASPLRVEAAAN